MEGDIFTVSAGGQAISCLSARLVRSPLEARSHGRERRVDEGGGLGAPVGDISQPVFNEFEEVDRRFFARESRRTDAGRQS